jgi:ubiquinone/menaquinone biosynthesis C-methylase UbiE
LFKKILQKLFPFLFSSKTHLAYGVEESPNKYPLDKARYPLMASYIHEESLRADAPLRVLDVGCRDGNMLLYCKHNGSNVEFHGMDITKKDLETAIETGYKSGFQHDIRNRPFPYKDDFFDAVICSHILEHLEHPGEVLEELGRVMKKGGLLIVGVPIGLLPGILWRRYVTPIYNPRKRKEEILKRFGHVSCFTLPELKRLLKKYGFLAQEARGDYFIRARKFCLEDQKWWFDFNQWWGKRFPGVLGYVNVKARLKD